MVIQSVDLDGPFGLSELGPWEDGQAQVDGRGIDAIQGIFETERYCPKLRWKWVAA